MNSAATAHSYQQTIRKAIRAQDAGQVKRGSMLDRLCLYYRWIEAGQCIIRDIHAEQVAMKLNRAQLMLFAKMLEQAIADLPIRGVVLKARKEGISTFIESLLFFLSATYENQVASMLAHQADSTDEIFHIAKLIAAQYPLGKGRVIARAIHFDSVNSRYSCHTAGGEGIGAGGTPSMLHLSEVALWKLNKEETEYAAINAVPYVPESIIVYESTARGRELFWKRYERAARGESEYFGLFIPWFVNPDFRMDVAETLDREPEELALHRLANREYAIELSDAQLAWRRFKVVELTPAIFRQEFPATAEEAVRARKGLVLPLLMSCVITDDDLPFDPSGLDPQQCVGGFDHGWRDPTVLIDGAYVDQVLYILDVYHRVSGLSREHAEQLREGWTYYCDPSALAGRKELERDAMDLGKQVWLVPAPRKLKARQVEYISVEYGAIHRLSAEGRLKITAGCADRLILEAEHLTWNEQTGQPDMRRGEPWGHFDALDALRYCVMGISQGSQADVGIRLDSEKSRRSTLRAM
ncbi:MAG: hypothetical protein KAJ19_12810 [Gammaproteobacteria bacterium]|nr:hypothetical protein [Gammaproteobacteria bacterium]